MVAAWMSAETGVGPSIASGSQVCSGNCALLANAPIASSTQMPVISAPPAGNACVRAKMFGRLRVCVLSTMRNAAITRATSPITWVMNALRAAATARRPVVPEPDEQIAAQRDQCPPDDEDHQVGGEHERQHREDEEVHVAEEAGEPGIVLHVADAVDVDEEADAGDDHEHQRAQRIEREVHADREIGPTTEVDPVPEPDGDGAVPRRCADDAGEHQARDHERREDRNRPGDVDEAPAEHRTEEPVERRADQRKEQHQDDERRRGADVHSFISLRSSTSSSRPSRKICVISASPTTTSAAATTITMKAKI